jgi:hypothetical protein
MGRASCWMAGIHMPLRLPTSMTTMTTMNDDSVSYEVQVLPKA